MNINSQKIVSKHLSDILNTYQYKGLDLKEWSVRINMNRQEPQVYMMADPIEKIVPESNDFWDIIDSPEFDYANFTSFNF